MRQIQEILRLKHQSKLSIRAHLFVAVLGASNKTYVEAFENEQLSAWIRAHCNAWAFFTGVSRVTVPDNLKTGVIHPCRYEPLLHRSYQELAEHYGSVIIPARIKKPRDKEKMVLCEEDWAKTPKRDNRKVMLAAELCANTTMTKEWIARRLRINTQ